MLTCGIVGLPLAGKTTLFSLLTDYVPPEGKLSALAMANVPDIRVDRLSALYRPRKTVYGQIQVIDLPGLSAGAGKSAAFLDSIRPAHALIHVLRGFDGDYPHPLGSVDPIRDFNLVNYELLLADMALVETRLDRINNTTKSKGPGKDQLPVLEKCLAHLTEEQPMSLLALTAEEKLLLQGLTFFTDKPQLVVANLDEQDLGQAPPWLAELTALCADKNWRSLALSAQIEGEIAGLDPNEQAAFMADAGIAEPGTALVAREAYRLLGLISFFTVGSDEVRAWELRQGSTALEAAATIHSDLARGFIRADVYGYDDLISLGSEAAVKEKGLAQLVGKDYVVKDGEIVHIRFNV